MVSKELKNQLKKSMAAWILKTEASTVISVKRNSFYQHDLYQIFPDTSDTNNVSQNKPCKNNHIVTQVGRL